MCKSVNSRMKISKFPLPLENPPLLAFGWLNSNQNRDFPVGGAVDKDAAETSR